MCLDYFLMFLTFAVDIFPITDDTFKMKPNELTQLIHQSINACEKSRRKLYDQYAPKMFGVCVRFAKTNAEAEDLLQEGFIKIFKNLNTYRNDGRLEAWMRRVIINTAINYYKRKRPCLTDFDHTEIQDRQYYNENIIDQLSYQDILGAIRELPNGYRMVFNLNVIEGYTHREIGKILNISENTSKSQLSRAKKVLQQKLRKLSENISLTDNYVLGQAV